MIYFKLTGREHTHTSS